MPNTDKELDQLAADIVTLIPFAAKSSSRKMRGMRSRKDSLASRNRSGRNSAN